MWLKFYGLLVLLYSIALQVNCQTYDEEGWEEASQFILTGLNKTGNPCKDFYSFVCGKWTKEQQTRGSDDEYDRLAKVTANHVLKALKAVKVNDPKTPKYAKWTRTFYDQCLVDNTTTLQRVKQIFDGIRRVIGTPLLLTKDKAEHDSLSKRNVWRLVGEIQKEFSTGVFFEALPIKVPAACNLDRYVLNLEPTSMTTVKLNDSQVSSHVKQIAQLMNVQVDEVALEEALDQVLSLEEKLHDYKKISHEKHLKIKGTNATSASKSSKKGTPQKGVPKTPKGKNQDEEEDEDDEEDVTDDEKETVGYDILQKINPGIDWNEYFKGLLSPEQHESWDKTNALFVMEETTYFEDLNKVIQNYTTDTIFNYVFLKTMQKWTALATHDDVDKKNPKEECLDLILKFFAPAAVKILFDHKEWDLAEWRTDIQLMAEKIFAAFKFLIASVDWLDNEDKMNVIEKLNYIEFYSGIPSWLENDTEIDKRTFEFESNRGSYENLLNIAKKIYELKLNLVVNEESSEDEMPDFTANAFYHMMKIEIQLGLALPPMHHPKYPMAIKYGNLGWTIGHELLHAFDENHVDEMPSHLEYLMKDTAMETYERRKHCLIKQISSYCFKKHKRCASGKATLGEIMSDIDGLKIAYMAYKFASQTIGDEPPLPKLTDYTGDQMFFISAGRSFCSSSRLVGYYVDEKEEHGPNQARVEISVRNFPAFAQHFGCRVGDPVAPIKTCQVWGNYNQPSKRRY